jgi:hypothetical protein
MNNFDQDNQDRAAMADDRARRTVPETIKQFRLFTHNLPSLEDWSKLYPYTLICYRLAKRVVLEVKTVQEVLDIMDEESQAVAHVVTPNGKVWTDEEFRTVADAS